MAQRLSFGFPERTNPEGFLEWDSGEKAAQRQTQKIRQNLKEGSKPSCFDVQSKYITMAMGELGLATLYPFL